MQNIKAIIFDLGGVILNIDFNKASHSFKELGVKNFEDMYSFKKANPLFQNLEEGKITEEEFYIAFRALAGMQISEEQIKKALNSMLLDYRKESLEFLKSIKQKYKLYLLSNTNIIHYLAFNEIYGSSIGDGNFDSHFHKAYYSFQIGLRKPGTSAYNFVLNENNLLANETLFIDDSKPNIEGATHLGMPVIFLKEGMKIENLGL